MSYKSYHDIDDLHMYYIDMSSQITHNISILYYAMLNKWYRGDKWRYAF